MNNCPAIFGVRQALAGKPQHLLLALGEPADVSSAPPRRPHPEFPQQCRRIGVAAHAEILEGCQRGARFGRCHRLIGLSEQPVERQPGLHGAIGDLGLGEREQYCFQLPAGRFAIPGKVNRRIAAVFAPVA
jgi:hypothetical protein